MQVTIELTGNPGNYSFKTEYAIAVWNQHPDIGGVFYIPVASKQSGIDLITAMLKANPVALRVTDGQAHAFM